jgi:hypothetical protein
MLRLHCLPMPLLFTLIVGSALPSAASAQTTPDFGVLVMAHGGPPEWNQAVLDAVAPLRSRYRIEVAFGMADAGSMEQSVRRLESEGARRIGVVRLFASGESWRDRTAQILGIAPGAPARPQHAEHAAEGHHGHAMGYWKLDTQAAYALSDEGLLEAPAMGAILADRARAVSRNPAQEDVLVLAHGPDSDAENERWLAQLNARADAVRAVGFRRVQVETLREDWPDKRRAAEARIRDFVETAARSGGTAIVLPFRLQGFGPYAKVLTGLDYVADQHGLLPHPNVTNWIEQQIAGLQQARFEQPVAAAADPQQHMHAH